jgi:hypothetical protein
MGLLTTRGGKCHTCHRYRGACVCHEQAQTHRAKALKDNRPTTCGRRFPNGGTCYRTVAPGETCPRH